jgi:hypothetical protein
MAPHKRQNKDRPNIQDRKLRDTKMNAKKHPFTLLTAVVLAVTGLYFGSPAIPAVAQGAWYGEYFANRDLAGGPSLTRYDAKLDFAWGNGSPGGGIPSDGFSVRWTRDEWFEGGSYRFSYRSDDGIRIWVGNMLVVDDWHERQPALTVVDRVIPSGTYQVRVEYYENTGGATLQAGWEKISGGAGWRGEYYSNRELKGSPVLVRYDAAVDFDWKAGSPDPAVPADNFSVRWTRTLGFSAGTYRFNTSSDDGVRIYVDGRSIVDAWGDGKLPNTRSGDLALGEGQHTVVVEYYEHGGDASAHVWWNRLGTFAGWEGRYFDNPDMRGGPVLVRDDAEISFDWGEGAPAAWMPSDNFSAVWTRQINFSPGYYRLNARSDDGVRVWLDNELIMDYWRQQDYQWNYVDGTYLEGLHTIKVEYFEKNGDARVRFWWELSATNPTPVPGPTPAPTGLGPWQGEYFNNRNLTGTPALVRQDGSLDFDWGWNAPAPQINRDGFSVRWTGSFGLAAGRYTFTTFSDDGVRLYIDGKRLIDSWQPMRGTRSGTVDLSAGTHSVLVEYFERSGRANLRLTVKQVGSVAPPDVVPPVSPPVACAGGPLRLDAWPVAQTCTAGGWVATIFVQGHGGDCRYTYYWENQIKGGPTSNAMTFQVSSAGWNTAIVGGASVSSAGQTTEVELYVPHPKCP